VSWLTLLDSPWRYCYSQRMAKKKTSACMSKDPSKKRDSNTGEWRARTGLQNRLDTGQLRALDGVSGVDELQRGALPDTDPYNKSPSDTTLKSRRRSLDDMRQLSERIRAARENRTEPEEG